MVPIEHCAFMCRIIRMRSQKSQVSNYLSFTFDNGRLDRHIRRTKRGKSKLRYVEKNDPQEIKG